MRLLSALAILLAGCDYTGPQLVVGSLTVDGNPLMDGKVRLVSGDHAECASGTLSTPVTNGRFELRRTVEYGRLGVIVQNDTLCIYEGQTWVKAWHSVYGPASETLTFDCRKDAMSGWACTGDGLESNLK
jgi:hypothetical protein